MNMKKLYLAKQASAAGKLAAAAGQLSGQQPKEARPRAKGASATPSSKGEAGTAAPAPRSNAPGGADVVSTEANPREHGKHAGDSTASEAIPPPVAPASSSRGTGAKGGRGTVGVQRPLPRPSPAVLSNPYSLCPRVVPSRCVAVLTCGRRMQGYPVHPAGRTGTWAQRCARMNTLVIRHAMRAKQPAVAASHPPNPSPPPPLPLPLLVLSPHVMPSGDQV